MDTVRERIDVELPLATVYEQWTQFASFPAFMEGIRAVTQNGEGHLHWGRVGGVEREWDAELVELEPDRVIAWRAVGDVRHDGRVIFQELAPGRTQVDLELTYSVDGFFDKFAAATGSLERRVKGDLQRFKDLVESPRHEEARGVGERRRLEEGGAKRRPAE